MTPGESDERDVRALEALAQAKVRLRIRSPFFATLALFADFELSDAVESAATDGRRVFVRADFVLTSAPAALEYTILHEVLHAALLHPSRRKTRDPEVWNTAADIVVNGILVAQGLPLPEGAVRDAAIEDWRVEDIYELLLQERAVRPPQHAPPDLLPQSGEASAAGTARAKDVETLWHAALREAQAMLSRGAAGQLPAAVTRFVRASTVPRLDWRAHLWRFLARTPTDFEGFDRRFVWQGVYLETLGGTSLRVLVCVDTSASIRPKDLSGFMGEVDEILRTYPHIEVELFFADRKLHGPLPFRRDAPIPPPIGGGGTSFVPFFEHVEREAEVSRSTVCVYLTDGHGDFPKRACLHPTLWVVPERGAADPTFPFGEVLRLANSS
jgi:predicted metal-dependent peptidase